MQLALIVLAVFTVAANAVSQNSNTFNRDVVNPHPTQASQESTPSPTPVPQVSSPLQYPESTVLGTSNNKTTYESKDDVGKVTEWYKEKIRQGGYSVKNFVQTKVNGVSENKLSGTSEGGEIAITITSTPGESVKIIVENKN